MSDRTNLFAWTAEGSFPPAFISINQIGNEYELIVRSPAELGSHTAQVTIDKVTFDALATEVFCHDGSCTP